MPAAVLHDGNAIEYSIQGQGSALLLSAGHRVPTDAEAKEAWSHGIDPQPGVTIAKLLRQHAHTVVFDYEAHIFQHPKHRTLTLDTIAQDLLSIADAAHIGSFAFYGSSWLAMLGPHLARVSQRITGYAMGGFPPISAPLEGLLDIARRHHAAVIARAAPITIPPALQATPERRMSPIMDFRVPLRSPSTKGDTRDDKETEEHARQLVLDAARARQFVTFFADASRQQYLTNSSDHACNQGHGHSEDLSAYSLPRVCFVARHDVLKDGNGRTLVSLAAPVIEHRRALQQAGWLTEILETDALGAAQPDVVARILTPWLLTIEREEHLARRVDRTGACLATDEDEVVSATPAKGSFWGRGQSATDPIDAYLQSCGVPVELCVDIRLRKAAGALLKFLIEKSIDVRQPDDPSLRVVDSLRVVPGTRGNADGQTAESLRAQTRSESQRMQETLEIRIIRRLNELRPSGGSKPEPHSAESHVSEGASVGNLGGLSHDDVQRYEPTQ